jgi:hypothetical protein
MSEEENIPVDDDDDNEVGEGIDEKELDQEKNKLKALGLEKMSNDSFSRLMEHRKPEEKKEDKNRRPFML